MKNKYVNVYDVIQVREKINAIETRLRREAVYFIRMTCKMEKQMSFQIKSPNVYTAFSTLEAGIIYYLSYVLTSS